MKTFAYIVIVISMLSSAGLTLCKAEDWTTTDGKTYKNLKVISHTETTVTILDDNGGATVPLNSLSGDLQKNFGYDTVRIEKDKEAAFQEKLREGEATIKASTKSVKEVETDQVDFVGKPLYFQGTIDVSSYYNYRYDKAQTTHYAFKFVDSDGGTATLYMAKGTQADDLRARILREGRPVNGLFSVVILPDRFDKNSSSLLLELTQASFGSD